MCLLMEEGVFPENVLLENCGGGGGGSPDVVYPVHRACGLCPFWDTIELEQGVVSQALITTPPPPVSHSVSYQSKV